MRSDIGHIPNLFRQCHKAKLFFLYEGRREKTSNCYISLFHVERLQYPNKDSTSNTLDLTVLKIVNLFPNLTFYNAES